MVFAVQDEITTNVVKALQVELVEGEQARVWHQTTDNVQAWSCLTQAVVHFNNNMTSGGIKTARKLLEEALRFDPNYAAAWVWLGQMHWHDVRWLWSDAPDESLAKAAECAERAGLFAYGPAGLWVNFRHAGKGVFVMGGTA